MRAFVEGAGRAEERRRRRACRIRYFLEAACSTRNSYHLAPWRVASEEIDYRRFFDVNELAALRMEDPAVFEEVHRFVFELVRRRAATGFASITLTASSRPGRLPAACCRRAAPWKRKTTGQSTWSSRNPRRRRTLPALARARHHGLRVRRRPEQSVRGSAQRAGARRHLPALRRQRRGAIARRSTIWCYRSKKQVLDETMSGDINSLGHRLNRFSECNRHFRDFTLKA